MPDNVENAGTLGIENDDLRSIVDRPDTVTPSVTDIAQLVISGSVDQGAADAAVLLLHMHTNEDQASWSKLSADLVIVPNPANAHTSPAEPLHPVRLA